MSTRSGRRIHGSIGESEVQVDAEPIAKSVKKTRSKRLKDNSEVLETTVPKSKKRNNYVTYPSDEEPLGVSEVSKDTNDEPVRAMRKNALKEQDLNISSTVDDTQKPVRLTRRTKRFVEDESEQNEKEVSDPATVAGKKGKKNKKKSKKEVANENEEAVPKKSKRKKKSKNKSPDASIDSFHSAAGSPVRDDVVNILNSTFDKSPENCESDKNKPVTMCNRKRLSVTLTEDLTSNLKVSVPKVNTPNNKRVSKHNSTFEITDVETTVTATKPNTPKRSITRQNSSFDTAEFETVTNTTFEKEKRRSSVKNGTLNVDSLSNTSNGNTTFDKAKSITPNKLNTTFEKEGRRKSLRLSSTAPDAPMNSTYDKEKQSDILNSTFDKETKLNSTFDKEKDKSSPNQSSLVTSDDTSNLTYDKSDERISITSDDSRIENITPVLIESSLDESSINKSESTKMSIPTPLKREGTFTKDGPEVESKSSMESIGLRTPTKRMSIATPGSTPFPFSKSGQKEKAKLNVTRSIEKSRLSMDVNPAPRLTRVMFCSPVNNPVVMAQQKRKVIKSNLKGSNKSFVFEDTALSPARAAPRKRSYTHSDVEDARNKRARLDRQLRAAERLSKPRTSTSKPNEPTTPSKRIPTPKSKSESKVSRTKLPNFAALHQRRFQKMESLDECQERKAKRAKQLLTPSAAVAVLERSSPRGSEQDTAKEVKKPDLKKSERRPETKKEVRTRSKDDKSEVKVKSKEEEKKKEMKSNSEDGGKGLPTLDSLKRGYTRFGFKMNIGVNPFSVPKESKVKMHQIPKEMKVNGINPFVPKDSKGKDSSIFSVPKTDMKVNLRETRNGLTRQATQPSLAGVTVSHKEAARQLVMREKSFTAGRRDVMRKEARTVIKGVRTNRRFELQMQMRNIS